MGRDTCPCFRWFETDAKHKTLALAAIPNTGNASSLNPVGTNNQDASLNYVRNYDFHEKAEDEIEIKEVN